MKMFKSWLLLIYGLIIIQIILGGTTRLTESGLSITEWDVVMGTFPPSGEEEWTAEFDKYKESPQYEKINKGMSLQDFKFIYFWEYFHRLWGRMIGLVAIAGMLFFQFKKDITKSFKSKGWLIVLMIGIVGAFGWIMVASGLESRPWVNAYKLSIHLLLAVGTLTFVLWTYLKSNARIDSRFYPAMLLVVVTVVIVGLQLFLGGVLSGMRAALFYPTWPEMNGVWIPDVLKNLDQYSWRNFTDYDASDNIFMPAFIQLAHRMNGYLVFVLLLIMLIKSYSENTIVRKTFWVAFGVCLFQVFLGIMTLLGSVGQVPVLLGILHQIVGVILFQIVFYILLVYTADNV